MPIYEYRCRNGHEFEVIQRMSDDPVATCEQCDAPVERVFHPVAVHFKGSGFYTTDYGSKRGKTDSKPESGEKSKTDSGSKGDSGETSKTDSRSKGDSGEKAKSSSDSD